ncbi:MAG: hypothetical protein AB1758_21295, partial [Candidatus Eremiobacterota bacterium]
MKSFKHFAVAMGLGAALLAPGLAWADEPAQTVAGPDVIDRQEEGDIVGPPPPPVQPRPITPPPTPPPPPIRTEGYKKPDCKT